MWMSRLPTSSTNEQYVCLSVITQFTWKKPTASILDAWVRMDSRQVVSACRFGAGGIRRALSTGRIVDAPTR
jgi:hypothetical protein